MVVVVVLRMGQPGLCGPDAPMPRCPSADLRDPTRDYLDLRIPPMRLGVPRAFDAGSAVRRGSAKPGFIQGDNLPPFHGLAEGLFGAEIDAGVGHV